MYIWLHLPALAAFILVDISWINTISTSTCSTTSFWTCYFTHIMILDFSPGADSIMSRCLSKSGADYTQTEAKQTAEHVCVAFNKVYKLNVAEFYI